ncbi:hypothetical protein RAE19_14300 [Rhodoferax sp. TBRC 17660]|uniref:Uncharacterized protein n=1 Tax=Rhodoferax potami TaxID=3068338 RepID=A0ABU3KPV9_9BURK|nr:hypothetical protein [Rhodoferax sp. TBRC 17660]MDT7519865.1 hypothetical protein [Rhodoferax sp. TBRC 17660]
MIGSDGVSSHDQAGMVNDDQSDPGSTRLLVVRNRSLSGVLAN